LFIFQFDSSTSPWEDEETRQFYECIPDLKALVPGILYKDSEKVTGITQTIDAPNPIEGK
jgi:regulator of nonsense transcripts 2